MPSLNDCLIHAKKRGITLDKNGNVYGVRGKQLKLRIDSRGYYTFSVRPRGSRGHHPPVHRLVAYYKFGDIVFKDGIHVRHLDGNKTNNKWENIDIGTAQMNSMDRPKKERKKHAINASNHARKFDDETMQDILNFYFNCKSYKLTMEKFGIKSKGTLWYMLNTQYQTTSDGHSQNQESKAGQ